MLVCEHDVLTKQAWGAVLESDELHYSNLRALNRQIVDRELRFSDLPVVKW